MTTAERIATQGEVLHDLQTGALKGLPNPTGSDGESVDDGFTDNLNYPVERIHDVHKAFTDAMNANKAG